MEQKEATDIQLPSSKKNLNSFKFVYYSWIMVYYGRIMVICSSLLLAEQLVRSFAVLQKGQVWPGRAKYIPHLSQPAGR